MSKLALTAVLLASVSAGSAFSADMIRGYRETTRTKQTVYVDRTEECQMLMIEYRRPYEPHREFANHCFPPLDMTPGGTRGSSGLVSSETSTTTYAVQ